MILHFGEMVRAFQVESGSRNPGPIGRRLSTGEYEFYAEGAATLSARQDYVRERLRLLYVGITRAKKELVISGIRASGQPDASLPAGRVTIVGRIVTGFMIT